jgi:hypothetical protein
VDLNFVLQRAHLEPQLQFVSGLGPRKLAATLAAVRKSVAGGRVRSRLELDELLGKQVALNAVGFLRVGPAVGAAGAAGRRRAGRRRPGRRAAGARAAAAAAAAATLPSSTTPWT